MPLDLVIRNAEVVTAADRFRCDLGIRDGRIVVMSDRLEAGPAPMLDASGLLVLPGGVDVHCHLDEPDFGGARLADDFLSGSRAAACGGTTTIVPFATQLKGKSLRASVEDYHRRADGKSLVDYSFHLILRTPNPELLGQELPALLRDGYTSLKIFTTYDGFRLDDGQILTVLEIAQSHGGLVMIHCENDHCVCWMSNRLEREGKVTPRHFPAARGHVAEREATHRAISLAETVGAPIYIVHISSQQAMEQVIWARERGLPVLSETCPQYLTLSDTQLESDDWEAAKFICTPPPRENANKERLWRGLAAGAFDVVASDHCAYRMEGPGGRKQAAKSLHFGKIAPGVPGLETRLPILFSEGVQGERIDLHEFVALTATNPAKLFGLYPGKGTIAVGSDADLTFWDAGKKVTLRHELLHDASDYSPYEGMKFTGWPVLTMSRGVVVARDGAVVGNAGHGRFLKRSVSSAVKPAWDKSNGVP